MDEQSLPYDEIAVIIAPLAQRTQEVMKAEGAGETETSKTRSYDAFIYTNLKTETLTPVDHTEAGQPEFIGRLPLAGRERVLVHWTRYQNYILSFFLGEKKARAFLRSLGRQKTAAEGVVSQLFEVKGPFLETLFEGKQAGDRLTRFWWHSELPELVALPWELMAYGHFSDTNVPFSFLRGLPPQTSMPRVPVSGPLKLAFIHEPRITSKALLAALEDHPANIQITHMTEAPREALQTAAREGYELVHLVADGTVSLANDGTLYLRKAPKLRAEGSALKHRFLRTLLPVFNAFGAGSRGSLGQWVRNKLETELDIDKCSPSELSALLRGSRISILSLSSPKSTNTEPDRIDGYLLPQVYRAFCSLGSSTLPLPTIIAPVGATDDPEMTRFWRGFYAELGEHLDITKAMAGGLKGQPPLAMAMFQRHSDAQVFTRISAEQQEHTVDPTQLDFALQFSQELVTQLKAQFGESESMPESFKKLLSKETTRQARLKAELEPWIQTELENKL